MALAGLKALFDGEDLDELLNKLNRGFFEKTLASENPALKIVITHETYRATNHRAVKEKEARKSRKDFKFNVFLLPTDMDNVLISSIIYDQLKRDCAQIQRPALLFTPSPIFVG
ncbi:hypothetical protein Trydic_g7660 [Trypoxylus dichotomus]